MPDDPSNPGTEAFVPDFEDTGTHGFVPDFDDTGEHSVPFAPKFDDTGPLAAKHPPAQPKDEPQQPDPETAGQRCTRSPFPAGIST